MKLKKAPEFMEIAGYINTKPIKLSDFNGKVVPIVHTINKNLILEPITSWVPTYCLDKSTYQKL